jgi:allophanate hydrolase
MPIDAVGSFLALIPPPLSIGSVRLESGQTVKGFLCEGYALNGATEITQLGGWRAYRKQLAQGISASDTYEADRKGAAIKR